MNITFLVGNGFDISCGLHSSYKDFYNWYCRQPSASTTIEDFKQSISIDISAGLINWSDFEIGLGKYAAHFTPSTVSQLIECYEDSHRELIAFLAAEEGKIDLDSLSDDSISKLKNGLSCYYSELRPAEKNIFKALEQRDSSNNIEISFFSFNYTQVLDACIQKLSSSPIRSWESGSGRKFMRVNPNVIHVNGKIGSYPIVGVNDTSQIINADLIQDESLQSLLIKISSINELGYLWHHDTEAYIDRSKVVCIWGMSLGASDAKWWKKLIAWLKADGARQLIIFWHTNDAVDPNSIYQTLSLQNDIKNIFLSYASNISNDMRSSIRDRTHIIVNSKNVLNAHFSPSRLLSTVS